MTSLTSAQVDMTRVNRAADALREIQEELCEIFPERAHLIQQLIYALATREHVLIHGTFGTGKSDLVMTLLEAITGLHPDQAVFSFELTKATPESELFGIPNPRRMREEGVLFRDPEGTLLAAYFAELDELLDATPSLLRTLLGVLHERVYKRGRQVEKLPLRTAIASTNGDPVAVVERAPEMGAVIDRFLFRATVKYLTSADARRRMYAKFNKGERPKTRLEFKDLDYLSGLVVQPADQISDKLIVVYDEVIEAIRKAWASHKGWRVISDRSACKMLQLVEASALLNGRYEALPIDIDALRWAVCDGGNDEQHRLFDQVVKPLIDKAMEDLGVAVDTAEIKLLDKITAELTPLPPSPTDAELVRLRRNLIDLKKAVEGVRPQLPTTQQRQRKLLADIEKKLTVVGKKIDGV